MFFFPPLRATLMKLNFREIEKLEIDATSLRSTAPSAVPSSREILAAVICRIPPKLYLPSSDIPFYLPARNRGKVMRIFIGPPKSRQVAGRLGN